MNAISEQKISHITDMYVTADLYQTRWDKPKVFWRYEITMLFPNSAFKNVQSLLLPNI